jgi:zona occludens toxin
MIEYYTGVPGSGKTYRSVNHVYDTFLDSKHKDFGKYERFYTNINEFNYSYFNKDFDEESEVISKAETPLKPSFTSFFEDFKKSSGQKDDASKPSLKSVIKEFKKASINKSAFTITSNNDIANPLDFDTLLSQMEEIRQLYLSKGTDKQLLELADEFKLSNTLFIIDEAQNYFSDKNDTLSWWLSYHRHLHQDIILITQNLSLIYRKFLTFGEFFYKAVPSSLRLRGNIFTYHQYINYHLYKSSYTDTIKVKFSKEIYALYGSGANTQGKKVIYKFLIIALVLFVLVVFVFKIFISSKMIKSDSNTTEQSKTLESENLTTLIDKSKTFTVVCIGFECSCKGSTFDLSQLNGYITAYHLFSVSTIKLANGVTFRKFVNNQKFESEVLNVKSSSIIAR